MGGVAAPTAGRWCATGRMNPPWRPPRATARRHGARTSRRRRRVRPGQRAVHQLPPHADAGRRPVARDDAVQLLDPVVRAGSSPCRCAGRSPVAGRRRRTPTTTSTPSPRRRRGGRHPTASTREALTVLGLLAAASMSSAFVNTLFTQTVNFAADDFGVSDTGVGVAGSVVRAGIILVLPVAVLADRVGRRRVVTAMAVAAPVVTAMGAFAPSFPFLVATQAIGRPLGLALDFLVAVVAAEEMPRNSRAYAVSVLAMASGLGAGVAVMALPLADISASSWRLVYLISLVWLRRRRRHRPPAAGDASIPTPACHRPATRPAPVRRARLGRHAGEPLRGAGQPVPERLPRGRPRASPRRPSPSSRSARRRRPASA